ncbi:MAG TPA: hypothetical protein EYP82_06380 [Hydrogenothermaceae bacterium]|nr:hypothetical protein [Hydrogenothermaceae bacterium]
MEIEMEVCGEDILDALRYYNPDVVKILPNEVVKKLAMDRFDFEIDETYKSVTDEIIRSLDNIDQEKIIRAAYIRKFLG